MEGTVMVGSEAEIAARLERATRSGLASSSLASYSYSSASSTRDQPPTLADLLPHLGPPDALRCPACRASLPFGPRSRICLACTTPLETDFGEAEEELSSELEVDVATKSSSSSLSPPLEVSGQKVLSHANIPSDQGKSNVEPETVKPDVQIPFPSSGDLDSIAPAKLMGLTNVDGEKHASILDYSAKLDGISLEDFFSNQVKSQAPALATNSDMLSVKISASMDTSGISVRKDSLFWDPLSESIIPDGFDLIANTSETTANKVVALDNVVGVQDDNDPFSSWEGDFQSAAPAMADVSIASSPHSHGPRLSAHPITSRNTEDLFGDFSSTSGSMGIQGNNSWVNDGDLFGLNTDIKNTFQTDSQRSMDVDNFFGSGWQQRVPHHAVSTTSESQSSSCLNEQLKSSQEEDLFGIHSSKQTEAPIVSHSLDSVGEFTSTEDFLMEQPASASESGPKKNKVVGSLLAQLHDLSFLLADKLVIKTEGKNTKPDSFS